METSSGCARRSAAIGRGTTAPAAYTTSHPTRNVTAATVSCTAVVPRWRARTIRHAISIETSVISTTACCWSERTVSASSVAQIGESTTYASGRASVASVTARCVSASMTGVAGSRAVASTSAARTSAGPSVALRANLTRRNLRRPGNASLACAVQRSASTASPRARRPSNNRTTARIEDHHETFVHCCCHCRSRASASRVRAVGECVGVR